MIEHLDCDTKRSYNEEYDSYCCKECNIWLEEPCGKINHKQCWFDCTNRPVRPLDVDTGVKE